MSSTNKRIRLSIQGVRLNLSADARQRVPDVVSHMMAHVVPESFDEDMKTELMAEGLSRFVRSLIKTVMPKEVHSQQLALWPERQRAIVDDIGEAAIWVPSRDQFVPLDPRELSASEIDEAGDYLIANGNASIRRGNLLKRLAVMVSDDEGEAAA